MGDAICADQFAIQNEVAPFILAEILNYLKRDEIPQLMEYLDSINVTNEMVKEHLMGLTLDRKI